MQQAALTYFHHGADKLGWAEAALLAGIPADPSRYDPATNPTAARERRNLVLKSMLDQGDLTNAEYANASKAKLPSPETSTSRASAGRRRTSPTTSSSS